MAVDDGSWQGTSVLVTGAHGFIGGWLSQRLLSLGARVVVPRRDVPARSGFALAGLAPLCDQVDCDLCDYASVVRVLNEYGVEAVFHLAAQTIVRTANRSPLSTYEANVRGTYTLLEACRACVSGGQPVTRIVIASSDKAYGAQSDLPYRESARLVPSFPYDVSKACADMIARSYASTYDLPIAVARCANVYGGGDFNFSRIVPDVASALVAGRQPVIRSDGTPKRDLVYVTDVIEAYLAIAASLSRAQFRGRAWNVGTGWAVSVREVVARLIAISGRDTEPLVRGTTPPGQEIDCQYLDATPIHAELGWEPRVELDRGLSQTYAWYRDHLTEKPHLIGSR